MFFVPSKCLADDLTLASIEYSADSRNWFCPIVEGVLWLLSHETEGVLSPNAKCVGEGGNADGSSL